MSDLDTLAAVHEAAIEASERYRDRAAELAAIVRAGAYALTRGDQGYTQADIARACGVSPQRVGQWVAEAQPPDLNDRYNDPTPRRAWQHISTGRPWPGINADIGWRDNPNSREEEG